MPLAFALLGVAVLIVTSGLKGGTIADAFAGRLTNPLDPAGPQPPTPEAQLGVNSSDLVPVPGALPGGLVKSAKAGSPVAQGTSVGPLHPTLGLPGYPAHDYFAPSGSVAVAPVSGTVTRLSGHDPAVGPTMGPHGPFGWSLYITGDNHHRYFLTHLGSVAVRAGQKVQAGQQIGTVGDYAKYGTPSHIHMGVL